MCFFPRVGALALIGMLAAGRFGFAAEIHSNEWPKASPPLASAALEARIERLLADLTLEQKVGQLIQGDIGSVTPPDLRTFPLGSVLNGADSAPDDRKFAPARDWLALADRFYEAAMAGGRTSIPPLWATDAVHGHNNIVGATLFPHNIALGATRDPELIRRIGAATALEVRATGLDWVYAPTLAVVQDLRWGRAYESYAERPELVSECARALIEGLQGKAGTPAFLDAAHVLATAKHFLGDGGTEGGRDEGDNLSSEDELRAVHAAPYYPAIHAGVQTVMASFSSWQGEKMHADRELLTEVLKGRMGFDGLLIGDWNGHAQVPDCSAVSCLTSLRSGLDVLMAPDGWRKLYENTLQQVRTGELPRERLDDAVRRVLRVKLRAHLFEEGPPSKRPFAGHFELLGAPAHRALARRAVRESLVLLKNAGGVLPLRPQGRVLVAGAAAGEFSRQGGGWTLGWQGREVPNRAFPHAESVLQGIRRVLRAAGGEVEFSRKGVFQERPDAAIVVFGERSYAEGEGDVASLEYSPGDKSDLELLRGLRSVGIPVVAVFLTGRPLWVNAELDAADAFVVAWWPGSEGGSVADVIFRRPDGRIGHDFRGRLPVAWPAAALPGGARAPLYPYGYGMRYQQQ